MAGVYFCCFYMFLCCFPSVAQSCLTLCSPWTAAHQASLSFTISWSLLKLMSIESMMSSNHLVLLLLIFLIIYIVINIFLSSLDFFGRGAGDQIANLCWIIQEAREFQKNIYFFFIDYAKAFDCMGDNKLWKIIQEMGIPDHPTCLLRNLYAGQDVTVRTGQ